MKYILIFSLGLYYLFVLYVVSSPRVGDDYRKYYITRESDIAPKEVERMSSVPVPVREPHNSKYLVFDGWHIAEPDRRWAKNKHPRIIFRLAEGDVRRLSGQMDLKITGIPEQSGRIFLNDFMLREGELSGSEDLNLSFSADILKDTNEIRFELVRSQVASNFDRRIISISIEELRLK